MITPISVTQVKINDTIFTIHKTDTYIVINFQKKTIKYKVRNWKNKLTVYTNNGPIVVERLLKHETTYQHKSNTPALTAPIPSTIVAILKQIGDVVIPGEKLIILEAMKMEHAITAHDHGEITHIFYNVGDQVKSGVELMILRSF